MIATLDNREFDRIQSLMQRWTGIRLAVSKKQMVSGRLHKRLAHHRLESFRDYFDMLASGRHPEEVQVAVDLLTTHETHFFRESRHFEYLRAHLTRHPPRGLYRVWSAACSSGEEPYTLAMVLEDALGSGGWEILGSDISMQELNRATKGHYAMERARGIPPELLRRCCLKGVGSQEGRFAIAPELKQAVRFTQVNLDQPLPSLGSFDAIFLRNVLIYFGPEAKRAIVNRIVPCLRPGGLLFVGHSESLNGTSEGLSLLSPSIYRKTSP